MPDRYPWDEKLPDGSSPMNPGGMDPKRAMLAKLLTSFAPSGAPSGGGGGGGTPAIVGQMPSVQSPTTPTGMPIPGLAPMSSAQAGGPAARHTPMQQINPGQEFQSKQARDAAVVHNTIGGLSNAVVQYKQHKFEQEAAQTAKITSQLIQGQMIQAKVQRGEPLTQEDLKAAAAAAKMDPKVMKLFEKAQKDPMSGAYVGIQRAKQQAQADIATRAQMDKLAAEADEKRAQAEMQRAQAKWYSARPDLEQGKIDQKTAEAQNKLSTQGMLKGLKVEFDAQGKAVSRPFTQAEIDADPMLAAQQKKELAYTNAAVARVQQGYMRLRNQQEELAFKKQKLNVEAALKSRQIDIAGKKAELPAPARKTISLAMMGEDYVDKMIKIVQEHPDGFGQGGWMDNKFKKALGNQEQWAVDYASYAKYAALPMLGIHNSRAASLAKDLDDWNGSMYQSSETTLSRLQAAKGVMKQAQDDTLAAYTMKPSELGSNMTEGGGTPKAGGGESKGGITIGTGADAITINPK